jgi:glycosyltransferase involved in cell wall biosynthesis
VSTVSKPGQGGVGKPKVVRIIARLNVGGPARQACILHEKLAPYFDTHLIIGRLADGEQDMSYLLSSGRNVLQLPQMSREISFWSDALAFWRILRFLRKERPDIVHTHTAKAGVLGRLAAWLAGVPIIVHTYHGHIFDGYFGTLKTKIYLAVERMLGRLSSRVIAVSESQKVEIGSEYRVLPQWKISVIQNGFEIGEFSRGCREEARKRLGLTRDDFVAVWAGRMVPIKDVQLLAQVIRKAAEKQSKICFLVVGDGDQKGELESLVRDCSNVRLLGWRHDMAHIWAAADVALLTSRNEGTPTALIEAMAAEVPFVAPNVGGVKDLAADPKDELPNGFGYKAANGYLNSRSPEALLYGIEQIAENPQIAREMGSAGYALAVRGFSIRRFVEEVKTLYQTLMAERRKVVSELIQQTEGMRHKQGNAI